MAIFVTGPHEAGKTLFAKILAHENFPSIDLGPTLRNVWKRQAPNTTFDNFVQAGERHFGQNFTDSILVEEILEELRVQSIGDASRLLLLGSRSVMGIQYIKSHIPLLGLSKNFVVYIEADEATLYQRYCKRNEHVSLEEFRLMLKKDRDMGLERIQEMADFVIANDGSVEEFELKVKHLVFELMKNRHDEQL